MELIAHLSVRRHLIEKACEPDAVCAPARRVAVFRVLGQSPRRALAILGANATAGPASTVVLTLAGDTLSEDQAQVCQAVISDCRSRALEFVMCGSDLTQLRRKVAPGLATNRWFSSVAEMVQQLGKADARHFGPGPERQPERG